MNGRSRTGGEKPGKTGRCWKGSSRRSGDPWRGGEKTDGRRRCGGRATERWRAVRGGRAGYIAVAGWAGAERRLSKYGSAGADRQCIMGAGTGASAGRRKGMGAAFGKQTAQTGGAGRGRWCLSGSESPRCLLGAQGPAGRCIRGGGRPDRQLGFDHSSPDSVCIPSGREGDGKLAADCLHDTSPPRTLDTTRRGHAWARAESPASCWPAEAAPRPCFSRHSHHRPCPAVRGYIPAHAASAEQAGVPARSGHGRRRAQWPSVVAAGVAGQPAADDQIQDAALAGAVQMYSRRRADWPSLRTPGERRREQGGPDPNAGWRSIGARLLPCVRHSSFTACSRGDNLFTGVA